MEINDPKSNQLYSIEWYIDEDDIEGYGIGRYVLIKDTNGDILYLDFTNDGSIITYRIDIKYITSIKEYNYERSKL